MNTRKLPGSSPSIPLVCCSLFLLLCQNPNTQAKISRPSVEKVENAGLLFTDNQAGVSGVDAGYSIPLAKQTLWLFGDVFLTDPVSATRKYVGGVSNCALLVPSGRGTSPLRNYRFLTDPITRIARQVLPNAADETNRVRLWPFGGWYNPEDKHVYLFYGKIQTTGSGTFDFRTMGTGLAFADASKPDKMEFSRIPRSPDQHLWWTEESGYPSFGSAVVFRSPGDYLYIIGHQTRAGIRAGKMARVRKSQIAEFRAYEYYAGGGAVPRWSRDTADAADVLGLRDFPTELSVEYNSYLGGYLAVHSVGISDRARLSLAANPWGPYRPIGEIGTPHKALSKAFCYAGKEHPELAEQNGRIIYITYVDNERYWLQLLKVTLKK